MTKLIYFCCYLSLDYKYLIFKCTESQNGLFVEAEGTSYSLNLGTISGFTTSELICWIYYLESDAFSIAQ